MIIAVEMPIAQHLHVNSRVIVDKQRLVSPLAWSVRVTGDFMIIMNNLLALPVIVRHPQRFNDSRSFMTAFKREFLQLMAAAPVPNAKVRMIRDRQFKNVMFTQEIPAQVQGHLQTYQNMLTGPEAQINWDSEPTNTALALHLAEKTALRLADADEQVGVMDLFEDYAITDYQLPAHPTFNEHNRAYLFKSKSLNDVMNVEAVTDKIMADYQQYLNYRHTNDQQIDQDINAADDYLTYCAANGDSFLEDITLVYNHLLHYEEDTDVQLSERQLRERGMALREFARFLRYQELFSENDFDQFIQAVGQGLRDIRFKQRTYYLRRLLKNMRHQVQDQRDSLEHAAYRYANKRYQLKVTLQDYQPSMWRQLVVSGDTRLDTLSYDILALFNANGHHLYKIYDQRRNYYLPIMKSGVNDNSNILTKWLGQYKKGDKLTLIYDFGDMWIFNIEIEQVTTQLPLRSNSALKLIAGQGSGIIDDIGGTKGLSQAARDDPSLDQPVDVAKLQVSLGQKVDSIRQHYE